MSKDSTEFDPVDRPAHYNYGKIQAIEVIDDWGLTFCTGNTVKYIQRAGRKDDRLQDLKKARWYLDHEIQELEKAKQARQELMRGVADGKGTTDNA